MLDKTVVGKFFREYERAHGDAALNVVHLLPRTTKIRRRRLALHGGTIANTIKLEIELNAVGTEGAHAVDYRSSTHF